MEKRQIINFVNFIRGCEPRCEMDLVTPVKEQIRLLQQYNMKGTFLLQYDALINPVFTDLLKDLPKEQFEIGVWFETVQPLVEKAGMEWRGRFPWDWHAHCGFSEGYFPQQRKDMIDILFQDFKEIFGYYPKSFGSWAFDAVTLEYASKIYGLDAACNCKDQVGTDGYTLWGGYYGQAYYPSMKNAYTPAQHPEAQIPVPVFRMLGSDPVLQYDFGYQRNGIPWDLRQGVITLEPVYNNQYGGGGVKKWVDWYLKENFNGCCLTFGYAQAGQENSFGWDAMKDGLEDQFEKIKPMVDAGVLEVETMGETGRWYKEQFETTPATTIAAWDDWKDEGRKSVWYSCKNYRLNLYAENGRFWIRDCYVFREDYAERYLEDVTTTTELRYDNLPVIDGMRFCGDGKRSGIYPQTKPGNVDEGMEFDQMLYEEKDGNAYVTFTDTPCGDVTWCLTETGLVITKTKDVPFYLVPVYGAFVRDMITVKQATTEALTLCFREYAYTIQLEDGFFDEQYKSFMNGNSMKVRFV